MKIIMISAYIYMYGRDLVDVTVDCETTKFNSSPIFPAIW